MQIRQVLCLCITLPISALSYAAHSPETNKSFGELPLIAKYCGEGAPGEKIDIDDALKYLSARTESKKSCRSCDTTASRAKAKKAFKPLVQKCNGTGRAVLRVS